MIGTGTRRKVLLGKSIQPDFYNRLMYNFDWCAKKPDKKEETMQPSTLKLVINYCKILWWIHPMNLCQKFLLNYCRSDWKSYCKLQQMIFCWHIGEMFITVITFIKFQNCLWESYVGISTRTFAWSFTWVVASFTKENVIWTNQRACATTLAIIHYQPISGIGTETIARHICVNDMAEWPDKPCDKCYRWCQKMYLTKLYWK